MIQPTVGRVVWYRVVGDEEQQPQAATVAHVNENGTVNLSVADHEGNVRAKRDVPLIQDGESAPESGDYCEWMPYQKAVAAGELAPTLHKA